MKRDPVAYGKAFAAVASGKLSPAKEKEILKNFLDLIARHGLRKNLPKILAAAQKALREDEGLRKVTIETAREQKNVRAEIGDILKKSDIIEEKVDPEIVAGVKITLDDTRQYDGSLARKINALFTSRAAK